MWEKREFEVNDQPKEGEGRLTLTMKHDEAVVIEGVRVYLRAIKGRQVQLTFIGPKSVAITRVKKEAL